MMPKYVVLHEFAKWSTLLRLDYDVGNANLKLKNMHKAEK